MTTYNCHCPNHLTIYTAFMVTTGGRFYELFTTRNAGERMGYNRLEISGVTIYGNVFRPKSYGVKRRIDCMLNKPSNSRFKNSWNAVFVKCA